MVLNKQSITVKKSTKTIIYINIATNGESKKQKIFWKKVICFAEIIGDMIINKVIKIDKSFHNNQSIRARDITHSSLTQKGKANDER